MSLEGNKIVGAVLLAGVLAMGAGYTSKILVGGGGHHGAHHGDDHGSGLGKVINLPEVEHSSGGKAPAAEAVLEPVLPLLAAADLDKGKKLAKKCIICHNFSEGGKKKPGPNLYNVVNREIASLDGYTYGGLKNKAGQPWTYANLNGFLKKPKKWEPATKMVFAGFKKVEDRANIIGYLRSLSDSPAPIE